MGLVTELRHARIRREVPVHPRPDSSLAWGEPLKDRLPKDFHPDERSEERAAAGVRGLRIRESALSQCCRPLGTRLLRHGETIRNADNEKNIASIMAGAKLWVSILPETNLRPLYCFQRDQCVR